MSDLIFQETIAPEMAACLIGNANLRDGAIYQLVSTPTDTVVLRVETSGDQVEFLLEDDTDARYMDVHFADIPLPPEEPVKRHYGMAVLLCVMLSCLVVGIYIMYLLSTTF